MKTQLLTKIIIAIPIMTLVINSVYAAVDVGGDDGGTQCQSGWVWCQGNTATEGCCAPNYIVCGNGEYCTSGAGGDGGGDDSTTTCTGPTQCSSANYTENSITNCSVYGNNICYKQGTLTTMVRTCNTCATGYTRLQQTVTLSRGVCNNRTVTYYMCQKSIDIGDGDGDDEGGTKPPIQQLCQDGYYKDGTSCSKCPEYADGVYGQTGVLNADSITDCYIPVDTVLSDSTGTYVYLQDCYYSN